MGIATSVFGIPKFSKFPVLTVFCHLGQIIALLHIEFKEQLVPVVCLPIITDFVDSIGPFLVSTAEIAFHCQQRTCTWKFSLCIAVTAEPDALFLQFHGGLDGNLTSGLSDTELIGASNWKDDWLGVVFNRDSFTV
jgi:hypothetical protein